MKEFLKFVLMRVGLTYAGVSLGIYWVSEEMISSRAASMRNPAWRIIYPMRSWILWSWRFLYRVVIFGALALFLVAAIVWIVKVMQAKRDREESERQANIRADRQALAEVEAHDRERERLQQLETEKLKAKEEVKPKKPTTCFP